MFFVFEFLPSTVIRQLDLAAQLKKEQAVLAHAVYWQDNYTSDVSMEDTIETAETESVFKESILEAHVTEMIGELF